MTAKISIQKCDVFDIDQVGVPSRVNSPLNKNHSASALPVHPPCTRTEVVPHSINLVHREIRNINIQAAKSACDIRNSDVPLSLISKQLRLQTALSLNVTKSTASSLAGMRTFLKGIHGHENQKSI